MPNKGGKKKGGKKKSGGAGVAKEKRQLIVAGDMEDYAKILKCLGDRRVNMVLSDTTTIVGQIPGRFRKRVWMAASDVVLISKRAFQVDKVDIVYKYFPDEIRKLHKQGEIPDFFLDAEATGDDCDEGVTFGEDDSDGSQVKIDFDDI